MAPKMGCEAPHTNWPTAMAKLMATMPSPVDVLSGEMNRPIVCRLPMVIMRISAETMTRGQADNRTEPVGAWVIGSFLGKREWSSSLGELCAGADGRSQRQAVDHQGQGQGCKQPMR